MKKSKKDFVVLKIFKYYILKIIKGHELDSQTEDIIIRVCQTTLDKGYLPLKALGRVCNFTPLQLWSEYESQLIKEGEMT